MRTFLLFTALLFVPSGFAQTGYFGSNRAFELKVHLTPSFKRTKKYHPETDYVTNTARLAYANYQLNWVRSFRRIEVLAGFEYSRMRSYADGYRLSVGSNDQIFLTDPRMNYFGINFQLNNYWRSESAPFGMYMGFSVQIGMASVNLGADGNLVTGSYGSVVNYGFIKDTYEADMVVDDHGSTIKNRLAFAAVEFELGRSFILNEFISFNVALFTPLAMAYGGGFGPIRLDVFPGYLIADNTTVFEEFVLTTSPNKDINSNTDWYGFMAQTVSKYNGPGLEIGFRFHL